MGFTNEQYKSFMKNTADQENRMKLLEEYNEKNNTFFKTPIEAMHKLTKEGYFAQYIADIFEVSKTCIHKTLKRIGAKTMPKGGRNNTKLSPLLVWAIRESNLEYKVLSNLLNVSRTCVWNAKKNKLWVDNSDVEFYSKLSLECKSTDLTKIMIQTIRS